MEAVRGEGRVARSPLHTRRDISLLIAPALIYLLIFSLFPLLYSLAIAFFKWDQVASSFTFTGLGNVQDLVADPVFWQAAGNSAVMTGLGVAIQVILGTALALFFDIRLRGSWFVRGGRTK